MERGGRGLRLVRPQHKSFSKPAISGILYRKLFVARTSHSSRGSGATGLPQAFSGAGYQIEFYKLFLGMLIVAVVRSSAQKNRLCHIFSSWAAQKSLSFEAVIRWNIPVNFVANPILSQTLACHVYIFMSIRGEPMALALKVYRVMFRLDRAKRLTVRQSTSKEK